MAFFAILCGLVAAGIHTYLFAMTAVRFDSPVARGMFRIDSEQQAEAARPWAYQFGFFHLFLAVAVVGGAALLVGGARTVGITVLVVGSLLMLATAVLHGVVDRTLRLAALVQGLAPLLTIYAAVAAR